MIINALFLTTSILFSLGQLSRISLYSGQAAFYLYELPLVLLLFALIIVHRIKPLRIFHASYPLVGLFFLVLVISYSASIYHYSIYENAIAFSYLLRLGMYFLYFIYALYHVRQSAESKALVKKGFLLSMIIIQLFSVVQYFFYPNLRNLSYLGWDPHEYRLFGTFLEPVILASVLGIFFIALLIEKRVVPFFIRTVLLSSTFTLILFTFARSVYVGFIATLGLLLLKQNKKVFMSIAVIFVVGILLLPKPFGEGVNLLRTSTIISRIENYQEALRIMEKNPVGGVGYNHIRYNRALPNEVNHAGASFHSSFLIIAVTGGVVGLIAFFAMLYQLAAMHVFMKVSLIFLGIVAIFDNVLLHPFILFMLFTTAIVVISRPFGESP